MHCLACRGEPVAICVGALRLCRTCVRRLLLALVPEVPR